LKRIPGGKGRAKTRKNGRILGGGAAVKKEKEKGGKGSNKTATKDKSPSELNKRENQKGIIKGYRLSSAKK